MGVIVKTCPATGEKLGEFPISTPEQVAAAKTPKPVELELGAKVIAGGQRLAGPALRAHPCHWGAAGHGDLHPRDLRAVRIGG